MRQGEQQRNQERGGEKAILRIEEDSALGLSR